MFTQSVNMEMKMNSNKKEGVQQQRPQQQAPATQAKSKSDQLGPTPRRTPSSWMSTQNAGSLKNFNGTAPTLPSFDPKPGNGIPGFQNSFNVSGKGGGAFRPISENFSVNQANGTLSLSIPIRTSPTRGGFGPEILLAYDSGAGNGPFGFGWSTPFSSVSRKTNRGIPTYIDNADDLALSGADIVPSLKEGRPEYRSQSGFDVVRYRPTVESSALRIEKWTKTGDSDDIHWRTVSSDNITTIYGEVDACRLVDLSDGRKRIFSWLISRSYDANGNAIEYSYKQEDGKGISESGGALPVWEWNRTIDCRCRQKYLKRIKYGNRVPCRNLDSWHDVIWPKEWMFELVYDYGEHQKESPSSQEHHDWLVRKDVFSSRNSGFEVRNYRLCRRILMYHHFAKGPGQTESLTASTSFDYDEGPQRTTLLSVTASGHVLEKQSSLGAPRYRTESLPPWTFSYTTTPEPHQIEASQVDVTNLLKIPNTGSTLATWIDLDGDGVPGLLSRVADNALVYQRNRGSECCNGCSPFCSPSLLTAQPSIGGSEIGKFQDLDGNGKIDYICLDEFGTPQGFYEREDSDSWSMYSSFPATPRGNLPSDEITFIDLTGDGLDDLLLSIDETNAFVWQQSLGKQGSSTQRRTYNPHCGRRPSLIRTSEVRTYVADMTGDGLPDLVEISANNVIYWPNLGHGHFGSVVEMGNPPALQQYGDFDHTRLTLSDVDGSGNADLVYTFADTGALLFYNLAGNSWSDEIYIPVIGKSASSSPLFVLDILGKGTASICWAEPSNSASITQVKYVDLMGNQKPHLLCAYGNGLGATTSIKYLPSTNFSQKAEAEGHPWTTKLPFPVHCVSEVRTHDRITGNSTNEVYKYHNGCYDSMEREFAGFEMVEQWQCDNLRLAKGESYQSPKLHVKSWFNVGLGLAVDETAFRTQSSVASCFQFLGDGDNRKALQSLRGFQVRTEIYGYDGSVNEDFPYEILEFSYDVDQIQPCASNKHSVVRPTLRASASAQYERHMTDPRVTREVVLKKNEFGDVEESLKIVHPRSLDRAKGIIHADVADNQCAGNVTFFHTQYTNAVDELAESYRKPLPWRHQEYEILHFPFLEACDVEALRNKTFAGLPEENGGSVWKALRSENITLFKDSLLTEENLGAGQLEAFSVTHRSYTLVLSSDTLDEIKLGQDRCQNLVELKDMLQNDGGYISLQVLKEVIHETHDNTVFNDERMRGSWWAPSATAFFATSPEMSELQAARRSFYTFSLFSDAFGNQSKVEMDNNYLLARSVEDAMGNKTIFENDYEYLQPVKITDANSNAQRVALDPLGRMIALALLGKASGEEDTDSLENFKEQASTQDAVAILSDPLGDVARAMLGNCGSRAIYCLNHAMSEQLAGPKSLDSDTFAATGQQSTPNSAFVIELSRDVSFRKSAEKKHRVSVTYIDGLGKVLQQLELNENGDVESKWLVSGVSVKDSADNAIRVSRPFFASTPDLVPADNMPAKATTTFYDAVGRNVGSLLPNHTWCKTTFTPWASVEHSFGNNVLSKRPKEDSDVGVYFQKIAESRYLPTWYDAQMKGSVEEQTAAKQSEVYSDSPTITHFGSHGLPIRQVREVSDKLYTSGFEYDYSGNRIRCFDSLGRLIEKNLYDKINRKLWCSGMDSGELWAMKDVQGNEIVQWNNRGICFQYRFDALRREIEKRMHRGSDPSKIVVKTTYGETQADASAKNLRGQIWQIKDQAGIHTSTQFDIRGRCVEQTFEAAQEYKVELDWQFDNELDASLTGTHKREFDNYGQVIWEMDATGSSTRRKFSRLGYVQSVDFSQAGNDQWTPYQIGATFSPDDLPVEIIYGNGTCTRFSYDNESRLLRRQLTTRKQVSGKLLTLEDLSHHYDCENRRIRSFDSSEQTKFFRNCRVQALWEYQYSAIGQLTSAKGRGQIPSASGKGAQLQPHSGTTGNIVNPNFRSGDQLYQYQETYEYDLVGNLLSLKHEALHDSSLTGWTRRYFYEEPSLLSDNPHQNNNRLSRTMTGSVEERYGYDGDAGRLGCMTEFPEYSTLSWNMDNMLASSSTQKFEGGIAETTYYVYDHVGNRVRKVTESAAVGTTLPRKQKSTFYLAGVEIQSKFQGGGTTVDSCLNIAIVNGDALIARVEWNEKTDKPALSRYQIGKNLELDDLGQLVSYEEYSPFGSVMYSAAYREIEAPRAYRFARYEHDRETGFYSCGSRYYAPWIGRWISCDPIGLVGGVNLFAYCDNDPINCNDPNGTFLKPIQEGPQPAPSNTGSKNASSGRDTNDTGNPESQSKKESQNGKPENDAKDGADSPSGYYLLKDRHNQVLYSETKMPESPGDEQVFISGTTQTTWILERNDMFAHRHAMWSRADWPIARVYRPDKTPTPEPTLDPQDPLQRLQLDKEALGKRAATILKKALSHSPEAEASVNALLPECRSISLDATILINDMPSMYPPPTMEQQSQIITKSGIPDRIRAAHQKLGGIESALTRPIEVRDSDSNCIWAVWQDFFRR